MKTIDEAARLYSAGDINAAEKICDAIIGAEPANADALFYKGTIAGHKGQRAEAQALLLRAIAARPGFAAAHYNLGYLLEKAGNIDGAKVFYVEAAKADNNYAEAFFGLGSVLRAQRQLDEALKFFRHSARLKPNAEVHCHIGTILQDKGLSNDARDEYRKALSFNPDHLSALNNLGVLYARAQRYEEALVLYEKVLSINPDDPSAINNLGILYKVTGQMEKAIACYRRGMIVDPGHASFHTNLLLAMIYAEEVTPEELAQAAKDFGRLIADPVPRRTAHANVPDPERKLRIGYVSPDFRKHAVNYFFEHLLANHDRRKFEIFGYSSNRVEDAVTQRLKSSFDHWRDITRMSDDQAADAVAADGIDILVDLAGHTEKNRLLLFARKPAPVQAAWLGYPATTGVAAIDYRITDPYADPPGMTEHLNVEKLWRLPEIFCCYGPPENGPPPPDRPPCDDNGYITFGCFNNFTKVTDSVLRVWARIMALVPDSRLLLEIAGIEGDQYRTEVEGRIDRAGLPRGRVMLEPRSPRNQYVLYNRVDIALDPFPCNGGTTSMDTLWMGVPFVTLAGRHFVSRMGVSFLSNAGLAVLAADSEDDYVDKAAALANDRERLRALREGLRSRVMATPVMDSKRFVRNMEDAYRRMWREWCAAQQAGQR